MAKEESKSLNILKKLTLPAVVGAGAYALARRGRTLTQFVKKTPKKNLTIIREKPQLREDKLRTMQERVTIGDKNVYIEDIRKVKKPIKGNVYMDVPQARLQRRKPLPIHPSAKVYNRAPKVIEGIFQDKLRYGRLKGGAVPATVSMRKHVGSKKFRSPEAMTKFLATRSGFYYKPRKEWASGGKGHVSSDAIARSAKRGRANVTVKKMWEDPNKYVAQEKLDIAISKGHPKGEHRVHVMLEGGKVKSLGKSVKRWGMFTKVDKPNKVKPEEVRRAMKDIIRKNPKLQQSLKGQRLILGADAVKTRKGQLKIIELNDQSGYLNNPAVAQKFSRTLSGKSTPLVASAKGGAAAGGTAVGQEFIPKGKKKRP